MWELPPRLVILTAWSRIRRARSVVSMAFLHFDETNVGIPRESFDLYIVDSNGVQQSLCFTGPNGVIQFVKRQDTTLRHSGNKVIDGALGRFVQVEVQEDQTQHEVRMFFDKPWNALARITLN